VKLSLSIFLIIFLLPVSIFASIPIKQTGNSYTIEAQNYMAEINEYGHITSIRVGLIELLNKTGVDEYASAFVFSNLSDISTKLDKENDTIIVSSPKYILKYLFTNLSIDITLENLSGSDLSYLVILSPQTSYIEHSHLGSIAATIADYPWGDVIATTTIGGRIKFENGDSIWGTTLKQQVWESMVLANSSKDFKIFPETSQPINPGLAQLSKMTISTQNYVIPNDTENVTLSVIFDNLSATPITSNLDIIVTNSSGQQVEKKREALLSQQHSQTKKDIYLNPKYPGFYKVEANIVIEGSTLNSAMNIGYNTNDIISAASTPDNFEEFWTEQKGRSVTDDKERNVVLGNISKNHSTSSVNVRDFMINDTSMGKVFGYISYPVNPGKYPLVIVLPGDRATTISPNTSIAQNGFIVVTVEPSGQMVTIRLRESAIQRLSRNMESKEKFELLNGIFRTMITIDSLKNFKAPDADVIADENRIAISGLGMGATIAIIVAFLDKNISAVAADMPYYCDITRNMHYYFPYPEVENNNVNRDNFMETLRYFDLINFAQYIDYPILISIGVNDSYSLPENIYAMANRITSAKMIDAYNSGHEGGGMQMWDKKIIWLSAIFGVQ